MRRLGLSKFFLAGFALSLALLAIPSVGGATSPADEAFDSLAKGFLNKYPGFSPTTATWLGDHRFDDQLDDVSAEARDALVAFAEGQLLALRGIGRDDLSAANQVDYELLEHELEGIVWRTRELQEWAWNPLVYTQASGGAIYNLVARDFAPLTERLSNVASRLEKMPRYLAEVRSTLEPARVPKVHAETAAKQNPGLLSILDQQVTPDLDALEGAERERLERAMDTARGAIEEHQKWIDETLVPNAAGEFRIGTELFDRKLAFALHTPLTREQVRERAEKEFRRVREEMYEIAKTIYSEKYPKTEYPLWASEAFKQAVTRAALEDAYKALPPADKLVETAEAMLDQAIAFTKEKDLVEVPDDPVEIIIMPEFQRGIAVAYCDSPGPLDAGQTTFYAVAPLPEDWSEEQVRSFLREYNEYSMQDLTIHEGVPGHFLQLALSNRYPSTLRAVLGSGPFIEGWAVYAERIMVEAGYLDDDPLMQLIQLKWYLRAVTNAILDQAIHIDGMTQDEAMALMVEGAFQEEREAAGKWVRAQLTSAQLSTYFVGYQEHADLRAEWERLKGEMFSARAFHDQVLSYGSPPVQFVRALMLKESIPGGGGR